MSEDHQGESPAGGKEKSIRRGSPGDRKPKKQRSADLGRALRSVYDDTLREPVPDDFTNLLGKLS